MLKKLIFSFGQKNIVLAFLGLLILGKLIFRFDVAFLATLSVIFFVTIGFIVTKYFMKRVHTSGKNSLIIASIIVLLLGNVAIGPDLFFLAILIFLTLFLRKIVRYRESPIVNTAVLFGLIVTLIGYFWDSSIFIGWSGVNYTVKLFGYTFPYASIISVITCIIIIIVSRKYLYALGFFSAYILLGYTILGSAFMDYSLLDGTIYFFFGVMALEPKTGAHGKYQLFSGILLATLLVGALKFHIPGDYLLVLAIMNLVFFIEKIRKTPHHTLGKTYPKGQKWICLPCGMIYDPLLGDPDGNIKPGTEFHDIPDSWRCPECGVTKADFAPYEPGKKEKREPIKVIEKTFLNETTVELILEIEKEEESKPGQFMSLIWHDEDGEFQRSYSIARQQKNQYTFLIKLTEHGRGSRALRAISLGESILTRGVLGHFILQDTSKPKIFLATGTGLAPIYNMITALSEDVKKSLYFSVSTEAELFYVEVLRSIPNLSLHIHITREKVAGYKEGRVDVDSIEASLDSEWYLCGNPRMVSEAREKLTKRGFTKIYSEEFN